MSVLDESYKPRKGDRILCALAPQAQPYSLCAVTRSAITNRFGASGR